VRIQRYQHTESADIQGGPNMLVLQGHTNSVQALAYVPDGKMLISAGDDCTIRLWDVQSGREVARLQGHTDSIQTLSIHPDGNQLASGGHDKQVRLWDLTARRLLNAFPPYETTINAVAFSADGQLLASGAERGSPHMMHIRDLSNGNVCPYSHLPARAVWSLAFAPGPETILATGWSSGVVDLFDVKGLGNLHELVHPAGVTALAFSPDGHSLAALFGNSVTVWDVQTGQARMNLLDHTGHTWSVAYSPDGRSIATGSWDSTVRLWDAGTGHERARFDWQLGERINAVAFAPDGMTAACAGTSPDIVIWDLDDV